MKKRNDEEKDESLKIYGKNAVLELLKSDQSVDCIYLIAGEQKGTAHLVSSLAKEKGIPVRQVPEQKLENLSEGERHQGIVAVLPSVEYASLDFLLKKAEERGEPPFLILADGIEDPHNLGAIIRTAESAGAHGLVIPRHRSATVNGTVFKTSAGAAAHLPVARVSNLTDTIEDLKKSGIWVYGADMDGESIWQSNLSGAVALVVGSEGKGIGQRVKNACDAIVSIPMVGAVNSLNASVAAGILMYEVARRRQSRI